MSENNKAIVRRLIEEVWNKGNLSLVDELFAPNYEHHDLTKRSSVVLLKKFGTRAICRW